MCGVACLVCLNLSGVLSHEEVWSVTLGGACVVLELRLNNGFVCVGNLFFWDTDLRSINVGVIAGSFVALVFSQNACHVFLSLNGVLSLEEVWSVTLGGACVVLELRLNNGYVCVGDLFFWDTDLRSINVGVIAGGFVALVCRQKSDSLESIQLYPWNKWFFSSFSGVINGHSVLEKLEGWIALDWESLTKGGLDGAVNVGKFDTRAF